MGSWSPKLATAAKAIPSPQNTATSQVKGNNKPIKNHTVSDWESSQAGPFDRWPTGLGFEKFYGFIGGVANNWRPALYEGTTPIEPYMGKPNYNLDFDLADQAINWIKMQKTMTPDKPFKAAP
jgi:arylsulfatase A-like enzyme